MPSITYNLNIPNPPNSPQSDVPLMQANTNAISSIINVDHYTFGTTSPFTNIDGLHKQVTLVNETAPGLNTGNGVLFANVSGGQSMPFWQNAAAGSPFPLALITSSETSIAPDGYFTIGGLIFQWGSIPSPGAGPTTIVYPLTPFPNDVFTVLLTARNDGSHSAFTYYLDGAPTLESFTYAGSTSGSETLYWFAIGN